MWQNLIIHSALDEQNCPGGTCDSKETTISFSSSFYGSKLAEPVNVRVKSV